MKCKLIILWGSWSIIKAWMPKNWWFWIVVLEKTLERPLDYKEIKPVNPKGNQPWIFIGRADAEAEAEAPILWPSDMTSRLTGKDADTGKDWRQEEKGTTEVKMAGWYHQLNGHEFEQTLGDSEGQGSLACFSPWVCKELGMTEHLNSNNNNSLKNTITYQARTKMSSVCCKMGEYVYWTLAFMYQPLFHISVLHE